MDAEENAAAEGQTGMSEVEVDPVWMSSRTARQIYALGEVEKVRTGSQCGQCITSFGVTGYQQTIIPRRLFHVAFNATSNGWPRRRTAAGWRAVGTIRAGSERVL